MKQIQASRAKAQFAELLDDVERGETVVVTRHGKPVARIEPAATGRRSEIEQVIAEMKQLRKRTKSATLEEIITWRNEGRK